MKNVLWIAMVAAVLSVTACGGKSNTNAYLPNWPKFREINAA